MTANSIGPVLRALCAAAALAVAAPAPAQPAWPSAPMKIVLPLPPGGGPDAVVRSTAELLRKRFGQPVTVENRAGASGLIGLKTVSTAPADGLTLAYLISAHVTADLLSPSLDLLAEFEPVTMDTTTYQVILARAESPHRTLAELVAAVKKSPGKFNYGSGGNGSALHVCLARFADAAGMKIVHVPYKGGVAASNGLAGGEVDLSSNVLGSAKALLAAGRLRALAVAAPRRMAALPDVPTVQEAIGLAFECPSWGGYAVRKGTSPAIVAALHQAITQAGQDPGHLQLVASNASVPAPSASPQAFAQVIRDTYATEREIITRLGIRAE